MASKHGGGGAGGGLGRGRGAGGKFTAQQWTGRAGGRKTAAGGRKGTGGGAVSAKHEAKGLAALIGRGTKKTPEFIYSRLKGTTVRNPAFKPPKIGGRKLGAKAQANRAAKAALAQRTHPTKYIKHLTGRTSARGRGRSRADMAAQLYKILRRKLGPYAKKHVIARRVPAAQKPARLRRPGKKNP